MSGLPDWLRGFLPPPLHLSTRERLRSSFGALVALLLLVAITPLAAIPMLIAPMGASAVLLFGMPASPLAQPWSIVMGNIVSAAVGVTVARWFPQSAPAAAAAVALALAAMFALRCVHPPSGAVALSAVMGGPAIQAMGYQFVFAPVAIDSIAMVTVAILFHSATGHRYPHRVPITPHVLASEALDAVLDERGEMLDIDVEDLQAVVSEVEARMHEKEEEADILH